MLSFKEKLLRAYDFNEPKGIKAIEHALQKVIEDEFPCKEWWEVCRVQIYFELQNQTHPATVCYLIERSCNKYREQNINKGIAKIVDKVFIEPYHKSMRKKLPDEQLYRFYSTHLNNKFATGIIFARSPKEAKKKIFDDILMSSAQTVIHLELYKTQQDLDDYFSPVLFTNIPENERMRNDDETN